MFTTNAIKVLISLITITAPSANLFLMANHNPINSNNTKPKTQKNKANSYDWNTYAVYNAIDGKTYQLNYNLDHLNLRYYNWTIKNLLKRDETVVPNWPEYILIPDNTIDVNKTQQTFAFRVTNPFHDSPTYNANVHFNLVQDKTTVNHTMYDPV